MLSFDKVFIYYGKIQVLYDVSVEVKKGEIVILIGVNGVGKLILLMMFCGLLQVVSGSICYEGEELVGLFFFIIMCKSIVVVLEGCWVFFCLMVEENLVMGGFFIDKDDYQVQMDKVLEFFLCLKECYEQCVGIMFGGEQQMFVIGCVLMSKLKLLLLDEFLFGLVLIIIQQIFEIIEQLCCEGVIVFFVEQNVNQVLKFVDCVYVLENGWIVMYDIGVVLLINLKVCDVYFGG